VTVTIKCLKCGEPLTPEMQACPKCGSRDRLLEAYDVVHIQELMTLKAKGKNIKYIYREKISKKGKLAKEELLIDKKNRIKIHRVKEIDEKGVWITVHEERIPLR
jgi:RNA polymerase subunit RPABC4/transcription elongation factor Spt4